MDKAPSPNRRKKGWWHSLTEGLSWKEFKQGVRSDFRGLREYYFTREQQEQLARYGWLKRTWLTTWWLIKILFFKLTPVRRILLLIGVLLALDDNPNSDSDIFAVLLILFVLMLELKDKLLAHHELAEGHAVQKALLPDTSPGVPGWDVWLFSRTANEVGGDLIDFFPLNEKRFGLSLGDVVGKGLGAALLMAKLQATIRAFLPISPSLSELGERLNHIFHRDTPPQSFASLLYLEIAADSGQARLLNAGHMPPLVLKKDAFEELPKGDPALGLIPEASYQERRITLQPGEQLLVYSDGLTEACTEAGEFYGEKRLFELFARCRDRSARETGETLLADVERFVGMAPRHDDLSIIILKRSHRK